MTGYRTFDVPVAGGDLHVGVWEPRGADASTPTIFALHGVTASHLAWAWLADELPEVRIVAPDLRGRGRSAALRAGGMSAHADDLRAVLDHMGVRRAVVVGHSMGAFAALTFADRHRGRLATLTLVDGGLPLDLPPGMSAAEAVHAVLGPTVERLSMRFATAEEYLDFWRAHPAFARDWDDTLEAYLRYDLVPDGEAWRPATSAETVEIDSIDQNGGVDIVRALENMPAGTVLLTAERGLLDQVPPLYSDERVRDLRAIYSDLIVAPIRDVNHYTILMGALGAHAVARTVRDQLAVAAS